jgi:hypothetical protein
MNSQAEVPKPEKGIKQENSVNPLSPLVELHFRHLWNYTLTTCEMTLLPLVE